MTATINGLTVRDDARDSTSKHEKHSSLSCEVEATTESPVRQIWLT